jgi:MG2 domain.
MSKLFWQAERNHYLYVMKRLPLLLSALFILMLCQPSRAGERVRMHCDRSLYAAGETVWLRAWVTEEAEDAEAAPTSKFLYVELLRDGVGGVEKRVKLKERSGMFFGQLELPEDLESGWYTLRAYTRAQKDWPAEALFHTRLLIRGAGAIPGLYSASAKETPEDQGVTIADASGDAIRATLSQDADGHLSVSLTDAEGHPVAGNFALSVVPGRYGDYDYHADRPVTATAPAHLAEGPREYTQDLEFRVKCVRNRLPDQYHVAIMSQDIGYYYSTDVPGDRAIKGEEGQSFRIPDLDFPEETLFSVNVTGSKFLFPADEPEVFAEPFDYGPTYPVHDEIRDTAVISRRLEGLATPPADADTITAAQISAERKPAFYKHPRIVGPYSNVFEWRQVKLREDLKKYDDMDLMTYIATNFPGLFVTSGSVGGMSAFRSMYTTRSATLRMKVSHGVMRVAAGFDPVSLYIDGSRQEDWTEAATFSVRNVQNLFVLRGAEAALYNAGAVVLLELRRFDESMIEEARKNERKTTIGLLPLGYQIPKAFPPEASEGTLYWNPCIRTDAQGHALISLPAHPDGCYIRLVGQTLDGRWFSAICE